MNRSESKVTIQVATETGRRMGGISYAAKRQPYGKVKRGCLETDAPTIGEAKALFSQSIEKFLDAYEQPRAFTWRGHTMVLSVAPGYPEPVYGYFIVYPSGRRGCGSVGLGDDKRSAVRSLKRHLVQLGTRDYKSDADVAEGHIFLAGDEEGQREHLRYAGFQRAYVAAETSGESDCHRWAIEHADAFAPVLETLSVAP